MFFFRVVKGLVKELDGECIYSVVSSLSVPGKLLIFGPQKHFNRKTFSEKVAGGEKNGFRS
jgi:hypothetical protein